MDAGVHLDAGKYSLVAEQFWKGRPICGALPQGLVVEDDTADVLLHAGRGEQQLPIGTSRRLGGEDVDAVKSLADGGGALIGGKDPLACTDHGHGGVDQSGGVHGSDSSGSGVG